MANKGVGDTFQTETRYERGNLPGGRLNWNRKPSTYKSYPSAPRIELSPPQTEEGAPIWHTIQQRRSVRRYTSDPLPESALSQLLWSAQGVTAEAGRRAFRAAPSAGALYPVETYVAIHRVEGIEPGIYHYTVGPHALEELKVGDFREATAQAALDQGMAAQANFVFIWTAIFERSKWKYRQRAYRYIYLDAGHVAENVALAAVALDLGSCQIGALYDEEANALLDVDGERESVIYMTTVGRPAE